MSGGSWGTLPGRPRRVRYMIRFTDDDALPTGHDWMLIRMPDAYFFFIRRSGVTEEALMEGWAAYAQLASRPRLRSA